MCLQKLFIITIALCFSLTGTAQHISTDSIGAKTVSEDIYNKALFSDSLASSFVIIIKKEVKPHKHLQHSEHVIVLDGTGLMRMDEKSFEIKKGDVVFIPKNTVHSVKSTGKQALKVLSVQAPRFDGKDRVFID